MATGFTSKGISSHCAYITIFFFTVTATPEIYTLSLHDALPIFHATSARARFGTDLTRSLTTPLVGRELERTLLTGTFERAVRDRSVQLVSIVGEPGVGKSRLVAELAAFVDAWPDLIRWRQGRSLPYGDAITFWALGEIVKAEAGILETDPIEE